jgi:thiamine biosynthesis lipoprotein ApbE/Na+-translocating ferredoxin:NAD+ oxidoreductase RnfG subunit
MGSLLEITLYGTETDRCRQAIKAAFAEVLRLEGLLSPFKSDSDLSRINQQASYGPVKTDPEIIFLIQQALAFARLTQGALDLTISPLMKLWGFRKQETLLAPPTTEQIQRALRFVGYPKVIVDTDHSTVKYRSEGVQIEFGAMGKGYAIDRGVQVLKNYGVTEALVSFGSTSYALGHPPEQEGLRVAIRHPRNPGHAMDVVVLKDCAISTSGDYEQGVWINGKCYGHIIDPISGYPVTGTVSVSVIAPTALESDVLSTAAFVLGPEAGLGLLENQVGVEGLIVTQKNGKLLMIQTNGWKALRLKTRPKALLARRRFLAASLAAVGLLMMNPWLGHAIVYMTREEALRSLIPQAGEIREETVKLTSMQKDQVQKLLGSRIREETYTFWIGEKDRVPVGYALILEVIGKEQPITFMVAVSPDGKIQGVEVLIYRESQGSEIRSRRFMQQFTGKTVSQTLKVDRDIDSISGATLSSRSTAYAVKKALALVEVIYRSGRPVSP